MKLAVLTSGGDSAGMNAVVRTVVKKAILEYDYLYSTCGAPASLICIFVSLQRL